MQTKLTRLLLISLLALATSGCLSEVQPPVVATTGLVPGAVVESLEITTSPSLPSAVQFENYAADLAATGGTPAYSWAIQSGSLPAGLALDAITGEITGIALASGSFNARIRVTDSQKATSSKSFTLEVAADDVVSALEISTSSTLPTAMQFENYSVNLIAFGGVAPYSWALQSGSLPPGLALDQSTGEIAGSPTVAGSFETTIEVMDSQNSTLAKTFTLQVNDVVAVLEISTSSTLPPVMQFENYSVDLIANGGVAPYSWALQSGSLPTGLSLNQSTGEISGSPTVVGSFETTIQVMDSLNSTSAKTFTLEVNEEPAPPSGGLLDNYSASTGLLSLSFISNDLSGITYVADRDTFFLIQNSGGRIWEVDSSFNRIRTISMSGFGDSEDIVYLGNDEFAIVKEASTLYIGTISVSTTSINADDFQSVTFDSFSGGNNGYEGVAFDANTNTFWSVKEFGPRKIVKFQRPAGTANITINAEVPFDAGDLPASDLSAVHFDSRTGNLLILSDESHKIMEVAQDGTLLSELPMADNSQHEGLTLDSSFNLIVTSEPNRYRIYSQ